MAMEENKNNQQELDETEEEEGTQPNGGTNGAEDGSNNDGDSSDDSENREETKSFTQKQLNKMMTREKNQGRNAALRELGIDPKDKKTIALLQSILKGTGNGQQSEGANGQQSEGANDQQLAEANKRALVAEIKAEAMKQNAQVNFVDDIVTLVMSKMEADEESDMSTLVGGFKTKYPAWFEKATEEDKKESAGQRGTGSSTKGASAKGGKGGDSDNLGKRLAAQRKSQNSNKKSFWS